MIHKNDCFVCGKDWSTSTETEDMECYYCKEPCAANVRCAGGHFVCDRCHSLTGMDLIETYCLKAASQDPVEIAMHLMRNPQVKMHGPEHHFLVPAVLLTAYYNTLRISENRRREGLKKARERAEKVLGGFCGFYGDCGAAVGTGIMMSVITGATPLSKQEWRLSNLMTARSLLTIANHGGPRCCKRNSFLAIACAIEFLKEQLGTTLPVNRAFICEFSSLNKECLAQECPFHAP